MTFSFSHLEGTHLEHSHYNQSGQSMQNKVSCVMWKELFTMLVRNLYGTWPQITLQFKEISELKGQGHGKVH